MEVWKDIAGYEGLYQVSDMGRVRSCKRLVSHPKGGKKVVNPRVLKPSNVHGYPSVILCTNGTIKRFSVHRLVAIAFLDNPMNLPEVNHLDGNRANPEKTNLEWCSSAENKLHAKHSLGVDYRTAAKRNKRVIRSDGRVFVSINEAAKESGVPRGCIYLQMQGKRKHTGGYQFRYAEEREWK